jgi:hypothetical protein
MKSPDPDTQSSAPTYTDCDRVHSAILHFHITITKELLSKTLKDQSFDLYATSPQKSTLNAIPSFSSYYTPQVMQIFLASYTWLELIARG